MVTRVQEPRYLSWNNRGEPSVVEDGRGHGERERGPRGGGREEAKLRREGKRVRPNGRWGGGRRRGSPFRSLTDGSRRGRRAARRFARGARGCGPLTAPRGERCRDAHLSDGEGEACRGRETCVVTPGGCGQDPACARREQTPHRGARPAEPGREPHCE